VPRGIDHLVIAAHDLDALSDLYRRLGFHIGARNHHPWGTINHIVQFSGSFLELISTGPAFRMPAEDDSVWGFAGFVARYLERREGLAMLVLESSDAKADHADFSARGIVKGVPFSFARKGRRPDGSDVELAFTVAFAGSPALPEQGFFVCEQHYPENFWNPEFQKHPNAVTGIAAVLMVAPDPGPLMGFLEAFSGSGPSRPISAGRAVDTGRGRIEVVTEGGVRALAGSAARPAGPQPAFAAVRFSSRDLAATRAALGAGRVPFTELHGRLVVSEAVAHGVALIFESAH
jgi:hypothetical protein